LKLGRLGTPGRRRTCWKDSRLDMKGCGGGSSHAAKVSDALLLIWKLHAKARNVVVTVIHLYISQVHTGCVVRSHSWFGSACCVARQQLSHTGPPAGPVA
jgi:hypothetical protein